MIINFYNEYHLGDCTFHIHFLRKLLRLDKKLLFNFFVQPEYINELSKQLYSYENNIKLYPLELKPNSAINSWIGTDRYIHTHPKQNKLNEFYAEWFTKLAKQIGIDYTFNDRDLLFDNEVLLRDNILTREIDYLIVNSVPLSGQFYYYEPQVIELINMIYEKTSNIIVTKNVPNKNIACTLDYNLSLMDIGNLSIKAKNIIAVNTSPIIPCFNIWNIDSIERWYVLDSNTTYTYNDRILQCDSIYNIKNILLKNNII